MAKIKKHYLNNKEFLACIVEYRESVRKADVEGSPRPRIPNYAGQCIKLICERMATRPNFSGYSYKTDMVSDAILNSVQAFDNFDPEKSNNPFGYFSRISWRAMLRRIYDERKENYVKHKNYIRLHMTGDHQTSPTGWVDSHSRAGDTSSPGTTVAGEGGRTVSDTIIEKFEDTLVKRRESKSKLTSD